MTPTIRDARPEDVPGIVDVHIRTWQIAYEGQLPASLLEAQDARRTERAEIWDRSIRNASAQRQRILVAELDGRIVGFASAGPDRDSAGAIGEVYAIYLDPTAWGHGVGRALFGRASEWLLSEGYREAVLWVLGSNVRARRFYEAAGWRADGGMKTETFQGTPLEEVRYRADLRQLSAAGSGSSSSRERSPR